MAWEPWLVTHSRYSVPPGTSISIVVAQSTRKCSLQQPEGLVPAAWAGPAPEGWRLDVQLHHCPKCPTAQRAPQVLSQTGNMVI